MIPNYQQFMRPFLDIAQTANGNEVKLRNIINELAGKFSLTEVDKTETPPNGKWLLVSISQAQRSRTSYGY
jgi:restriction system protein